MNYHGLTLGLPHPFMECQALHVVAEELPRKKGKKKKKELTLEFLPLDNFSKEYPITFYSKQMDF